MSFKHGVVKSPRENALASPDHVPEHVDDFPAVHVHFARSGQVPVPLDGYRLALAPRRRPFQHSFELAAQKLIRSIFLCLCIMSLLSGFFNEGEQMLMFFFVYWITNKLTKKSCLFSSVRASSLIVLLIWKIKLYTLT